METLLYYACFLQVWTPYTRVCGRQRRMALSSLIVFYLTLETWSLAEPGTTE